MRWRPVWIGMALAMCSASYSACPNPDALMGAFGFTTLRPPSRLLLPGAMVLVHSQSPFSGSIICSAESSLGHDIKVVRSPTASGTLRHLQNQKQTLDVQALGIGGQKGSLSGLSDVTVTLRNPEIWELTDDAVLEGMMYRTENCRRAIRQRVAAGYTITMISAALISDASLTGKFSTEVIESTSKEERLAALKSVSATLGAESHSLTETAIEATGLVFGLRDSEYLSALSIDYIDENQFARDANHLPTGQAVAAPIVKP